MGLSPKLIIILSIRSPFNEHSQWIGSLFAGFDQRQREALSSLLLRVWRNVEIPAKDSTAVAAGDPR